MTELTRIQIVVCLQSCDLFAFCKAEEVLRLAGIARERHYAAGSTIYEPNGPPEYLYSVVHGEVRLDASESGSRTAGPLQTFGVTEILCGRLRTERAVAVKDTLVLAIEAEDFFDLLANNIEIVRALFRHLLAAPGESGAAQG